MLAFGTLAAPARAARWPAGAAYGADVPTAWFDRALELVRLTPGFSPPVASRAYGYAGVALYEAVVAGIPERKTLAGDVNGLTRADVSADAAYHWASVANGALAEILRALFPTAPQAARDAVDELEQTFGAAAASTLPRGVWERSAERGRSVARHVFEWSTSDGGHEGFRRNFPAYTPPVGPGLWAPTPPGFLSALQPTWGENRPFALPSADACAASPPLPYSEEAGSLFYADAHDCYLTTAALTPEQHAVAQFWSDDPGQTATPPGHSISIATQALRNAGASLALAAEAYAKVGVAVADAFIACWRTKYRWNVLRPVTYIRHVIDPSWTPLLVTPPFPEYTSGHSVQSGAAATVLTRLLGDGVAFTDHTHDARGLAPRSFPSFFAAAHEAASSRLYGGIHFRAAIERGLEQGSCVGSYAASLG